MCGVNGQIHSVFSDNFRGNATTPSAAILFSLLLFWVVDKSAKNVIKSGLIGRHSSIETKKKTENDRVLPSAPTYRVINTETKTIKWKIWALLSCDQFSFGFDYKFSSDKIAISRRRNDKLLSGVCVCVRIFAEYFITIRLCVIKMCKQIPAATHRNHIQLHWPHVSLCRTS